MILLVLLMGEPRPTLLALLGGAANTSWARLSKMSRVGRRLEGALVCADSISRALEAKMSGVVVPRLFGEDIDVTDVGRDSRLRSKVTLGDDLSWIVSKMAFLGAPPLLPVEVNRSNVALADPRGLGDSRPIM